MLIESSQVTVSEITPSASIKTIWVPVCSLSKVPSNKAVGFRVNGQRMILTRCADTVHVFQGFCSHQQYPLAGSKISDCRLTCSLHRSSFSAEDGTVQEWASLPGLRGDALAEVHDRYALKHFGTRVEGDSVLIEWPAEKPDDVRIKLDF